MRNQHAGRAMNVVFGMAASRMGLESSRQIYSEMGVLDGDETIVLDGQTLPLHSVYKVTADFNELEKGVLEGLDVSVSEEPPAGYRPTVSFA